AAYLFQEGSQTVIRNELRRAASLHPRSAAKWFRCSKAKSPAPEKIRLSVYHFCNGDSSGPIRALRRASRRPYWRRRSRGYRRHLLDRLGPFRSDGEPESTSPQSRRLVPRRNLRTHRWIFDLESANLRNTICEIRSTVCEVQRPGRFETCDSRRLFLLRKSYFVLFI